MEKERVGDVGKEVERKRTVEDRRWSDGEAERKYRANTVIRRRSRLIRVYPGPGLYAVIRKLAWVLRVATGFRSDIRS